MIPVIVIVCVLLFVFYSGYKREKNDQIKYIDKLLSKTGKDSDRKILAEELACAKAYCEYKGDSTIDDITWNDLDMNLIYRNINFCQTSAGDEYLYYILRKPNLDENKWEDFEKKIKEISSDKDLKRKLLYSLCQIGRSGKYCVYNYLDCLDKVEVWSDLWDVFSLVAFIPCIGLCFINGLVGAALVFILMIFNISTYFKKKRQIESYFVCFQYILRITKSVDSIKKIDCKILQEEMTDLVESKNRLAVFNNMLNLVTGDAGNSPVGIVLDYLRMLTHVDLIAFKKILRCVRDNKDAVINIIDTIGKIDCYMSIGEYRASLDGWCIPDFDNSKTNIVIKGGYHPLIKNAVKNDLTTDKPLLLTGSNASGKSTFLKMIAINCLLAQTIHTVLADEYVAPYFRIYTSLSLKDNIVAGDSYYMAEIKSIKRIFDSAKDECRVIGFVDEVLRGTNTVERIAASTAILKDMSESGVFAFAATHDIELTYLLEDYDNYHFEEKVTDGDVTFSYKLKDGRATTRNAIKLLELMGYNKDIIDESKKMVESFEKKGNWN